MEILHLEHNCTWFFLPICVQIYKYDELPKRTTTWNIEYVSAETNSAL